LKADGADVALVQVEVVDAKGNRCPTALNMVDFKLEGNAEWRGGIAQGPDNYILAKSLPVEGGVNRVFIRSTTQPGQIVLTATSKGLKSATAALKSVPVTVINGLSLDMPYDGLTPSLKRGPTPATPAFTPVRRSLKIAGATAGSNSEKAVATFDDDETTNWTNDGKTSTAWITYTLAEEATVSEVAFRFNGFRTISYPVKILVDGKEVYSGTTPRSLGYVNLPVKPTKGKTVTVQLAGATSVNSNANAGVEVGGQKLEEGVSNVDPNAKGTFNIIETDIFAKSK
jgi:hypothetical protein